MLSANKYHEETYFSKLEELAPMLKELSTTCYILWLSQYPTLEFFGPKNWPNSEVHSGKIFEYTLRADRIIR